MPEKIERRDTSQKKQLAFWVPHQEKELYEQLQNHGVKASYHCREALSKVIRFLAEQEGLIKTEAS